MDVYAGRTLTAFFDDREDAHEAVDRLVRAGVNANQVTLVEGNSSATEERDHKGFWESLKDFFFPDEDRDIYAEGLRRGGYIVTARQLSTDEYDVALDILDDEGAIDLDQRTDSWRSEGWTGYSSTDTTGRSTRSRGEGVIPVVAEELRVGKRDVGLGRVRVRSYVVEEPVSETVRLHREHVIVDRRPVDRPAGDDAFRDRTIEAEEHEEEAVVAKDARVVEEVAIRQEGTDRDESVAGTVRHTEVEVDDQRDGQRAKRQGTV